MITPKNIHIRARSAHFCKVADNIKKRYNFEKIPLDIRNSFL